MTEYAHPEVLVSTDWVASHGRDPGVRVVEVDVDTSAYDEGHIPGAIAWSWKTDLCDTVRRDILSKEQFEELMSRSGVSNDTTPCESAADSRRWKTCSPARRPDARPCLWISGRRAMT